MSLGLLTIPELWMYFLEKAFEDHLVGPVPDLQMDFIPLVGLSGYCTELQGKEAFK